MIDDHDDGRGSTRPHVPFGEFVAGYRSRLAMTQEDLAQRANLAVRTIRKIEQGKITKPRPHTIRALASAFELVGAEREQFFRVAANPPVVPPTAAPAKRDERWVAPAQLPADVLGFTGRVTELGRLDELLLGAGPVGRAGGGFGQPTALTIAVVTGMPGAGKTAMTVHWAHRSLAHFPDGQLYVDLRGYDPDQPRDAAGSLSGFLFALGMPAGEVPLDVAERSTSYRTRLAGRRMLVVLDNASSAEQVRPLLPGTASCAVVVTSRDSLPGLIAREGSHRIVLDLLSVAEARTLLGRLIGPRVTAEPAAVGELVGLCAQLPLALRVVAELAVARPATSLTELATELADVRDQLGLLDAGDDPRASVRAVFSWSVSTLPDDAARTFALAGLHPGRDFDRHVVAAMADTSSQEAGTMLAVLARAHLVHRTGAHRYGMHDLVRAYANELCRNHVPLEESGAALGRLLDHYLHTALAADLQLNPHRRPIATARPRPGANVIPVADYMEATTWFRAEMDNLLVAARFAMRTERFIHAWQLPWAMVNYLHLRGRWPEWIALHLDALVAARRLAHHDAEATTLHTLARGYNEVGQADRAYQAYGDALQVYRDSGDLNGQANTLNGMSGSALRLGHPQDALELGGEALDLYTELADPIGQASTLNLLGRVHRSLGNRRLAVSCHRKALAIFRQTGDEYGEANALDALGETLMSTGRPIHAAMCLGRSIPLHEVAGNRFALARAHRQMATAQTALGHYSAAKFHYDEAVAIFSELGRSRTGEITRPSRAPHP